MEEKLNEFLIKEIEKGIESLKKDEEQLQNEFDEYGYKNNDNICPPMGVQGIAGS